MQINYDGENKYDVDFSGMCFSWKWMKNKWKKNLCIDTSNRASDRLTLSVPNFCKNGSRNYIKLE